MKPCHESAGKLSTGPVRSLVSRTWMAAGSRRTSTQEPLLLLRVLFRQVSSSEDTENPLRQFSPSHARSILNRVSVGLRAAALR